jgi:hypothetical protein
VHVCIYLCMHTCTNSRADIYARGSACFFQLKLHVDHSQQLEAAE